MSARFIPNVRRALRGAVLIAGFALTGANPAAAEADYCAEYGDKDSVVLFVLDRTTFFDAKRMRRARAAYARVLDLAKPRQRVMAITISRNLRTRETLFDNCRPGCKLMDLAFGACDADRVRARHEPDFVASFRAAMEAAIAEKGKQDESAVIDTLAEVTRRFPEGVLSDLIIFSDMINRDDLMRPDLKNGYTAVEIDELLDTLKEKKAVARLWDAHVHVYGFGVDDLNDNPNSENQPLPREVRVSLESFWRRYFTELAGARDIRAFEE